MLHVRGNVEATAAYLELALDKLVHLRLTFDADLFPGGDHELPVGQPVQLVAAVPLHALQLDGAGEDNFGELKKDVSKSPNACMHELTRQYASPLWSCSIFVNSDWRHSFTHMSISCLER